MIELDEAMENQLYTAINSCQARIENGAEIGEAFTWLTQETEQILNGISVYDD